MKDTTTSRCEPPLALLAELSHRCPLRCPYCSNPLDLVRSSAELDTGTWTRIFREAATLGVLQLHLSGGEPLVRHDLAELIRQSLGFGLYTNLITSGVLLDDRRLAELVAAGLNHVQISLQDSDIVAGDDIAGLAGAQADKRESARRVVASGLPLTLNIVVHRQNIERLPTMIDLAVVLRAERLEVAHAQYYGWALANRQALLPTREQLDIATDVVLEARKRLRGILTIDYVPPDYYAHRPKACMGGWAQRFIVITPSGRVLPCHAAETLPGLEIPSVHAAGLKEIWQNAELFQKFRGTDWMEEPCRSCDYREIDWGGCRCQAFALTGDKRRTDPTCAFAPDHALVLQARDPAATVHPILRYRGALEIASPPIA